MKITYDKSVDALYIYLLLEAESKTKSKGIVAKTKGDWPVHLDFTKNGKLFGIEIMGASKVVDVSYLKKLRFERIDQ
ncbi:MAG: DUF2283 domain-containing protein [Nanoarchaeota archaeon]|nr:DUF2283 domain-containing protein [Nanoarchaeota archaeon]